MCGICGLVELESGKPAPHDLLERMNAAITHRGPDSDGFHYDESVALAMRRLAIVDLSTGDQPMTNEEGTVWLVFNGEIFNFPDLRPKLEALGHEFQTNSDTEAIVHLYEEYGLNCVDHLRGQFAIAIWDSLKQRLLLARDRTGQKPLYYTFSAPVQWGEQFRLPENGAFYFGSEINTLLEAPIERRVNLKAIDHYLTLMYVPDPWTAFEGIYKLPPGHRMVLDFSERRQATIERYWDLPFEPKWEGSPRQLRQELRDEITAAVEMRLMSDVPLGAHLSGGIDSSIVVGLMARMMDQPVKTFSIGFPESRYDETRYAQDISQRFGTEHREFVMQADTMAILPEMVRHFGEPFADPAALPTWYLAEMTREHVTVALNGDGGDEAFAGYQRYFGDRYVDIYRLIPGPLRRHVLRPLIDRLPTQADRPMEQSYTAALRGLARGAEVSHAASKVRWSTHFQEDEKRRLYNPDMLAGVNGRSSADLLTESFYQAQARHRIDRTLYADLHHYLPGALLPKVDRMTMAHSLEARSPFLDHKVLELAARLPVSWKVRGQTTKWILRDLFRDLLPDDIITRNKSGFSVPLGPWFAGSLRGPALELLSGAESRLAQYFLQAPIQQLLDENHQGQQNHGKRIWTLLNLEMWLREYFG